MPIEMGRKFGHILARHLGLPHEVMHITVTMAPDELLQAVVTIAIDRDKFQAAMSEYMNFGELREITTTIRAKIPETPT